VLAHKTADVRRLIRAAGARVLYLPPYSPDLNPVELAWSKLKVLLRELGARARDALDDPIRRAMDSIDGADPPPRSPTEATPVSSSDRASRSRSAAQISAVSRPGRPATARGASAGGAPG
jgi:hypothetical protein